METILYQIGEVTGTAILYSLWQGLLVYFLLRLLFACTNMTAAARHLLALTALGGQMLWFLVTLAGEANSYQWIITAATKGQLLPALPGMQLPSAITADGRYNLRLDGLLPYISLIYFAGLLLNAGKLLVERRRMRQIRSSSSFELPLLATVTRCCQRLGIQQKVAVALSGLVDVPCVFGHFKPLILLPVPILSFLTTEQIETVILHELAHVRRNDYVLNLLQQMLLLLLFFNPFSHLLSKLISREREHGCDDLVVKATGEPLTYAHTLLRLQESKQAAGIFALAANGRSKYHLLHRIERIMKTSTTPGSGHQAILVLLFSAACMAGLAWLNPSIAHGTLSLNKLQNQVSTVSRSDTAVKKMNALKSRKHGSDRKSLSGMRPNNDRSDLNDPKLHALQQQLRREGEALGDYYSKASVDRYFNSDAWKQYEKLIDQNNQKITEYFNSAEWKELTSQQGKLAADLAQSAVETPEFRERTEQMGKVGADIGRYYNSPEFRQLDRRLRKKYGIRESADPETLGSDSNVRAYRHELSRRTPKNIRRENEKLGKMGRDLSVNFDTTKLITKNGELRGLADSLRKLSASPNLKQMQGEIRALGEQMRIAENSAEMKKMRMDMRRMNEELKNDPEIRRLTAEMRETQARMRAYMNSTEFRKKLDRLKKQPGSAGMSSPPASPVVPVIPPVPPNNGQLPMPPVKPQVPTQPDSSGNH